MSAPCPESSHSVLDFTKNNIPAAPEIGGKNE
jgi:hypothetical protein